MIGATCGQNLADGCGGTIASCGTCGRFEICGAQRHCVCASTIDEPDDLFEDTNCDGIDGDASQAIFVSMSGHDVNSGTKNDPVASISRAMALASASGKRKLFIATGRYLAPSSWISGVSLYGGYDTSWNRSSSPAARPVLIASSNGMLIEGLTTVTTIERVIIQGTDAPAGGAAQGLRVVNSGTLLFLRFVHVRSGNGGNGTDGAAGRSGAAGNSGFPGESATRGVPNTSPGGGIGGLSAGSGSGHNGGVGGAGTTPDGAWGTGIGAGAGGWSGCRIAGNGLNGATGATPVNGARGVSATGSGALTTLGLWVAPLPATAGQSGREGVGGSSGGGGGKLTCLAFPEAGGGGGGGGASGTGGSGGSPGTSGGASIAITLITSRPSLHEVSIETGDAGNGGIGGIGGAGGVGGAGGPGGNGVGWFDAFGEPLQSGHGGWGGAGGFGSAGGRGGDGAPGVNVGIWCSGVSGFAPASSTTWVLGAPGMTGSVRGQRVNVFGC
jgi:hypothetical protein